MRHSPLAAFLAISALLFAPQAQASNYSLANLSSSDFAALVKEFSANTLYTSSTAPSMFGEPGSVEFGIIGGYTMARKTESLIKGSDPNSKFSGKLYDAALLLRIALPASFTIEAAVFPKAKISGANFQEYGGAITWLPVQEMFSFLPINIGVRGHLNAMHLTYRQNVSTTVEGVPIQTEADMNLRNFVWGGLGMASMKLWFLEPYAGFGLARAEGRFKVGAPGTVATFGFQAVNNEAASKTTSPHAVIGLDATFGLISLGGEFHRVFGASGGSGRLSFRF